MHKSRLAGFIIDCETGDLDAAAAFWSKALGYDTERSDNPEDGDYVLLRTPEDELHIEVQKVSHPSRVHLDIEADDVEAEVSRLEALGARRCRKVRDWWVLEAPTGQRFCVVPAESARFGTSANEWE